MNNDKPEFEQLIEDLAEIDNKAMDVIDSTIAVHAIAGVINEFLATTQFDTTSDAVSAGSMVADYIKSLFTLGIMNIDMLLSMFITSHITLQFERGAIPHSEEYHKEYERQVSTDPLSKEFRIEMAKLYEDNSNGDS